MDAMRASSSSAAAPAQAQAAAPVRYELNATMVLDWLHKTLSKMRRRARKAGEQGGLLAQLGRAELAHAVLRILLQPRAGGAGVAEGDLVASELLDVLGYTDAVMAAVGALVERREAIIDAVRDRIVRLREQEDRAADSSSGRGGAGAGGAACACACAGAAGG